jgi:hypothetical protein
MASCVARAALRLAATTPPPPLLLPRPASPAWAMEEDLAWGDALVRRARALPAPARGRAPARRAVYPRPAAACRAWRSGATSGPRPRCAAARAPRQPLTRRPRARCAPRRSRRARCARRRKGRGSVLLANEAAVTGPRDEQPARAAKPPPARAPRASAPRAAVPDAEQQRRRAGRAVLPGAARVRVRRLPGGLLRGPRTRAAPPLRAKGP